nr:MAG TPA: hypothetical protein [Ackermannviridae sp.]
MSASSEVPGSYSFVNQLNDYFLTHRSNGNQFQLIL